MATWLFKTPTVQEGPIGNARLFYFYKMDVGVSVIKEAGVYYLARYLLDSDIPTYEEVYRGGRNYEVNDATKADLIAADIGITEANFTEV